MPKTKQTGHYVHRLSYSARERLVGTFILVALLFLIALIGMNEKTLLFFEPKVEFETYFQNAKGLSTDTFVEVLGVEVGKVSAVSISDDHRVHATIYVYDRYAHFIRAGSIAKLNRLAVIGGARIEISAGDMGSPRLPGGAVLPTEETLSLDELLEGLANLASMGSTESGSNLITDLSHTARDLRHFIAKVRSGKGALGTLIYGEKFHGDLTNAVALLEQVMYEASASMDEIKPMISDTGKVLGNITAATTDLPELLGNANQAIATLNTGLHQFPDLLVRLNLVLEEATRVLEAMQRVWPISSAVRQQDEQQLIEAQPVNE